MQLKSFTEIDSWKEARELNKLVYKLTADSKISKDYGFVDQLRRASLSIMLNIAEGFDSGSPKSFINFLNYSYRSASEVEAIMYIAIDLNYISEKEFSDLKFRIDKIKALIGGFIKYLKTK